MAGRLDIVLDVMEAEFRGKSWNGLSLMPTLDRLSAGEAASVATWEGYSAWEIALHCAKCKRIVAAGLGATVPAWPFDDDAWFPASPNPDDAAWERDRALLRSLHDGCMTALRSFDESRLVEEMAAWKAPWEKVIAWLATHDTFHGAQIRSMGLPSLKTSKHV